MYSAHFGIAPSEQPRPSRAPVTFSVVAPVYNEEETLAHFCRRVATVMEQLGEPYELLLIDDGSRDGSPAVLRALVAADPRLRVIELSRNFGHQIALSAGLAYAHGQAVITLDADLQDPPEVIPQLVALWRAGAQVVYARRAARRGESAFKRLTAAAFYRLLARLATIQMPPDAGDFRLLDRRVVDVLVRLREHHRYLRGLSIWAGFRQAAVPYVRQERAAGSTKFSLGRMLRFALDGITSFSTAPLDLALWVGAALVGGSLASAAAVAVLRLLGIFTPSGLVGVALLLALLVGVQLVFVGMLGMYVARIYDEVLARPLYIVNEVLERPAGTSGEQPATAVPTVSMPRAEPALASPGAG